MPEWDQDHERLEDYEKTRCPKCGQLSTNHEICDFCGAVFSKVREREYAGDTFSSPTPSSFTEETNSGSWGRVIFLVALFLVIAGGVATGIWIYRSMNPTTLEDLIAAHRKIAKRARQVIADEIETQKQTTEHKKLYLEVLDLGSILTKMADTASADSNEKIQIQYLQEANNRLGELLGMSTEEFLATADKMNYADPAEVDEKLNIAQNPELAKRATNPLLQTLDLLRSRFPSARSK